MKNGASLEVDETIDSQGALKRACIKVGRERPDALYALNTIDVGAFTAQCLMENKGGEPSPLTDRKVRYRFLLLGSCKLLRQSD